MPLNLPIAASGPRAPDKRPRSVPKHVRDVIILMVRGRPDDPDGTPLDFIEAARACGVKPDIMRKWLDRGEVRALLRRERSAWRDAICAGNEGALKRVRDTSLNGMAVIGAVRALENIAEEAEVRAPREQVQAGLLIVIERGRDAQPIEAKPVIEAQPVPTAAYTPEDRASVEKPAPKDDMDEQRVEPEPLLGVFRHTSRQSGG